ncbi:hypothetical protein EV363DRAFT_220682 [Boletus edulis]|nr:hypothetical protein EV363DRAFT_220682 [Boletus edulis]
MLHRDHRMFGKHRSCKHPIHIPLVEWHCGKRTCHVNLVICVEGYSSLAVLGFLSSLLSYFLLSHSDRSRCASVYVWFCSFLVSISLYTRLAHVFPHLRNMYVVICSPVIVLRVALHVVNEHTDQCMYSMSQRRRSRKKYSLITRRLREVLGVIKGILADRAGRPRPTTGEPLQLDAPRSTHWILCSIDQDRRFPQSERRGQSSSRHHLDRQKKNPRIPR